MNSLGSGAASYSLDYATRLQTVLQSSNWDGVGKLAEAMRECWADRRQVFLCGNGGSAGNALHLANDFVYGVAKERGVGMRALALPSNPALLTCLANDVGYDRIFSAQLAVQGDAGDLLIVLSGSGNSPNILKALEQAKAMRIRTFAIRGYSGGKAKALADIVIHFPVDDMQICEDLQLVVGHMVMQWLWRNPPQGKALA
jgi:D-sedoheptulose 7-phosphate isomerase